MDRFQYLEARLREGEVYVGRHDSVKLYNGDEKTHFEDGEIVLTTHRLFWGRPGQIAQSEVTLCLDLKYVASYSEETASSNFFGRKTRVILYLHPPTHDAATAGLDRFFKAAYIKLSGKNGLSKDFIVSVRETVSARIWEVQDIAASMPNSSNSPTQVVQKRVLRTGIGAIEQSIMVKAKETDDNISLAFQDLKVLMSMAKDMVGISKVISRKICEHNGEISADETVRFKACLLSLGIDDPVTRDNTTSNVAYYKGLARQICEVLLDTIMECGGMMSLADVYCRINRARGLELISPEDLLMASQQLDGPIKLRTFPSGAMVLQLESQDDEIIAADTLERVKDATSLTSEELAQQIPISLLLAKERLFTAERLGKLCRDESVEGLRFYPNLLLG